MQAIAEIRRIAFNYVVDGDLGESSAKRAQPDGILSSVEIVNGIARLERLLEGAKADPRGYLPEPRYERMITLLREALPEARAAEARGEGGLRYMGDSFYSLDWAEEFFEPNTVLPIDIADAINGDVNYGNNDGVVSYHEFRAASW